MHTPLRILQPIVEGFAGLIGKTNRLSLLTLQLSRWTLHASRVVVERCLLGDNSSYRHNKIWLWGCGCWDLWNELSIMVPSLRLTMSVMKIYPQNLTTLIGGRSSALYHWLTSSRCWSWFLVFACHYTEIRRSILILKLLRSVSQVNSICL